MYVVDFIWVVEGWSWSGDVFWVGFVWLFVRRFVVLWWFLLMLWSVVGLFVGGNVVNCCVGGVFMVWRG